MSSRGENMKSYYDYHSPLGKIRIIADETAITEIYFLLEHESITINCDMQETPLIQETARQIKEYFEGTRKVFEVPLAPQGSAFYQKVWKELLAIPFGHTRSYGELAKRIQHPNSARAVGRAAHWNPIGIIIPCHRLIGSNGQLVGYAGGLNLKAALLAHESEVMK